MGRTLYYNDVNARYHFAVNIFFCSQYFQFHLAWKFLHFDPRFIKICSQRHWSSKWLGAVRQQANVEQDLWRHKASLGNNELIMTNCQLYHQGDTSVKFVSKYKYFYTYMYLKMFSNARWFCSGSRDLTWASPKTMNTSRRNNVWILNLYRKSRWQV